MREIILIILIFIVNVEIGFTNDDIRMKLIKKQIEYSASILNKRIKQNNKFLEAKQYQFVDFIIDEYKEKGLGSFISKAAHDVISEKLAILNVMTGLHFYVYICPGIPIVQEQEEVFRNPQLQKKYAWYVDIIRKVKNVENNAFNTTCSPNTVNYYW